MDLMRKLHSRPSIRVFHEERGRLLGQDESPSWIDDLSAADKAVVDEVCNGSRTSALLMEGGTYWLVEHLPIENGSTTPPEASCGYTVREWNGPVRRYIAWVILGFACLFAGLWLYGGVQNQTLAGELAVAVNRIAEQEKALMVSANQAQEAGRNELELPKKADVAKQQAARQPQEAEKKKTEAESKAESLARDVELLRTGLQAAVAALGGGANANEQAGLAAKPSDQLVALLKSQAEKASGDKERARKKVEELERKISDFQDAETLSSPSTEVGPYALSEELADQIRSLNTVSSSLKAYCEQSEFIAVVPLFVSNDQLITVEAFRKATGLSSESKVYWAPSARPQREINKRYYRNEYWYVQINGLDSATCDVLKNALPINIRNN